MQTTAGMQRFIRSTQTGPEAQPWLQLAGLVMLVIKD